ncbi:MAG: AI-2E family transporter, partial [Chloroflexota bacterium]
MSPQWSSTTRIIVASVCLIVLGLMLYFARPLIGPIIVAALLAYALNPLVKLVKRRARLPHKAAVSLVYFLTLAILIATPSTLIPVLINQIRSVSGYLAGVERQVEALLALQVDILGEPIHLDRLWGDLINVATQSLTPAEDPLQVLETTSISLAWLLVILVSTFYLLLSWEGLYRWLISLPPPSQQPDLERLLQETNQIWKAYLRG